MHVCVSAISTDALKRYGEAMVEFEINYMYILWVLV